MGSLITHTYTDWASGIITSMEPDMVPPNGYSRGRNTELSSIGGGRAVVRQRKGFALINSTPVTGSGEVSGLFQYKKLSDDGLDTEVYNLVASDNGWLDILSLFVPTYGDLTTVDATAFTPRTVYGQVTVFCQANNICYIVNGVDAVKFDGTNVYQIGIERPTTAPTLAVGAAGVHNGTYEGRVTYGNSAVGIESSAGETSTPVVITNDQINWSAIPISPDPQVDTRYLYLRNTGTMEFFYLAGTVSDNSSTTATTNVLDVALTTIGPDEFENDPPIGGNHIVFHKNRLFLCNLVNILYSKLDNIEAFDPLAFESPYPNDGEHIFGMTSFADMLVIFKEHSMYALIGDDPDFWQIRQLSTDVGIIGPRCLVEVDGMLYWWSNRGPYRWDGQGAPESIGTPFIYPSIVPGGTINAGGGRLAQDDVGQISYHRSEAYRLTAGPDIGNHRVLFSVPTIDHSSPHDNTGTRNTIILPFNTRIGKWEADVWDPLDVGPMALWYDDDEAPFVICGGYSGQMYRASAGLVDATQQGTLNGTFVASGTTASVITDLTAAFDITGGKLIERKVSVVDSTGALVTVDWRPHITDNTATVLTLSEDIEDLVDGATYTYYIGAPAFDWASGWLDAETPFIKKRYRFAYVHLRSTDISSLRLDAYTDYLQVDGAGIDEFDSPASLIVTVDNDDTLSDAATRMRIGQTGQSVMVRIRHYPQAEELWVMKLGILAENLDEKLG